MSSKSDPNNNNKDGCFKVKLSFSCVLFRLNRNEHSSKQPIFSEYLLNALIRQKQSIEAFCHPITWYPTEKPRALKGQPSVYLVRKGCLPGRLPGQKGCLPGRLPGQKGLFTWSEGVVVVYLVRRGCCRLPGQKGLLSAGAPPVCSDSM